MSDVMNVAAHYQQQFSAAKPHYLRDMPWSIEHRENALAEFMQQGFPTRRHEEWKYTSVLAIEQTAFCAQPKNSSSFLFEKNTDAYQIVFINGHFSEEHSSLNDLPANVVIKNFKNLDSAQIENVKSVIFVRSDLSPQSFHALNNAFLQDGIFIDIPDNCVIRKPIEIISLTDQDNHSTHLQHVVFVGKNAQLSLIENYCGDESINYFTNVMLHFHLAESATVDHYKLQSEGGQSFHIGTVFSQQARNSTFRSHSYAFGGSLVRSDAYVNLREEGAHCELNGLYCLNAQQHTDHHTGIFHRSPRCTSSQLYKGLVADRSHAVFNGKIVVAPNAQKTQADQRNQTLLLSPHAQIDTKPQLEIFADDVKCAHGATVGQLDESALFYLRSRGINKAQASELLLQAFAHDVLARVRDDATREKIKLMFENKLKS